MNSRNLLGLMGRNAEAGFDETVPVGKTAQQDQDSLDEGQGWDESVGNITKSDLIVRLAARFPHLPLKDTDLSVKMIIDAMEQALQQGHRIEVRGFGAFSLSYRPARMGRNPKTGGPVSVPEKWVPHFKAGKDLREGVDYNEAMSSTPYFEKEE